MTSLELTPEQASARPLPGRVLLELDAPLTMDGLLHIPQTAQERTPERDHLLPARIIAIGYGEYWETDSATSKLKRFPGLRLDDVTPGDRVLYHPLLQDLDKRFLLTSVTRLEAILVS